MSEKQKIKTTRVVYPQIYAYILPDMSEKNGWIKIGYTERKDVHVRIKEQTHTAAFNLKYELLWDEEAKYSNTDEWFKDVHLHSYLTRFKQVERQKGTEWFQYHSRPELSYEHIQDFKNLQFDQATQKEEYTLRAEQQEAVRKTLTYFKDNEEYKDEDDIEFLWNAKPRFGKTLTAYHLAKEMNAKNVLVVTNRPAVANSWFEDFEKFIAWQTNFKFVSTATSLKDKRVMTRREFIQYIMNDSPASLLTFISLQDLKGAVAFGGTYDKLSWVKDLNWDLLIVDESHEGVDTFKTDIAFDNIKKDFTLYLSGTPFKAVASGQFTEDQIYNWTYADEQAAKENWGQEEGDFSKAYDISRNPYDSLPQLSLFSYQMSQMITDEVNQGAKVNGETIDYAFDLNEFFSTKDNGTFVYETQVVKWLDTLSCNEKYPFSTEELRKELKHTFWILKYVASAKALQRILRDHNVFQQYNIVLAAGDGKGLDDDQRTNMKSLQKVQKAIREHDRTITISVGQLTTGVTVPEWTAVFMLSNMQSPSLYMQAAFRSQNAWEYVCEDGTRNRKERAYVFDFAPERTLRIYDEFANNLSSNTVDGGGSTKDRRDNITRLLNFFPVISMDDEGEMVELDVDQVLTIPKTVKAQEVVRRGFMSNLLFQNISGIFAASPEAREILEQLNPVSVGRVTPTKTKVKIDTQNVQVDTDGNIIVSNDIVVQTTEANFGTKVYGDILDSVSTACKTPKNKGMGKIIASIIEEKTKEGITKIAKDHGLSSPQTKSILKENHNVIAREVNTVQEHINIKNNEAKILLKKKIVEAKNDKHAQESAKLDYQNQVKRNHAELAKKVKETIQTKTKEIIQGTTKTIIKRVEEKKKNTVEHDIRARLRGFARTIPSFLMAYGTPETMLFNFDINIDEDVFKEVTGITIMQFKLLRDEYQFFNEVVFNEAVQEFLRKKQHLANYFDKSQKEDIFDYIPPQKTNQIFTPKKVVQHMIDLLEQKEPSIFRDPNQIFMDFYMKSGLFLTEIITRLYAGLDEVIPDPKERIKHIMKNQVYGFAPSEIIYNIAKNFIMGFIETEEFEHIYDEIDSSHIVCLDTIPFALGETDISLEERCSELFEHPNWGENCMKYGRVVGNPPYHLPSKNKKSNKSIPIYHEFIQNIKKKDPVSMSFIIPSRWFTMDSSGLKEFRETMVSQGNIHVMHVYENPKECFPHNEIKGGVVTFGWNRSYNGLCHLHWHNEDGSCDETSDYDIQRYPYIVNQKFDNIFQKVLRYHCDQNDQIVDLESYFAHSYASLVSSNDPFGLDRRQNGGSSGPRIKVSTFTYDDPKEANTSIRIYYYAKKEGGTVSKYIDRNEIKKGAQLIDVYKVLTPKAWGGDKPSDKLKPLLVDVPSCCSETYHVVGPFHTQIEAKNVKTYIETKFFHFLVQMMKISQNTRPDIYQFVPLQDFLQEWSDEKLFEIYAFTKQEQDFINEYISWKD